MFTLIGTAEFCIISVATALLFALCSFNALGALQQTGYNGKTYAAWLRRKGNMTRSRLSLLAFQIFLAVLVIGFCFSFLGKWAAYCTLAAFLLFVILYNTAEKHALKVPLKSTARVARIYVINMLVTAVVAFAIVLGSSALAYYTNQMLIGQLRFLPLAVIPILLPYLLRLSAALERPISSRKNQKYIAAAKAKLSGCKAVKIAVTGSFGKTSVKNFLAQILQERYRVLATPESFNTPLGIAKTVEKVDLNNYDFFIAEMGARRMGDIAQLCNIVAPDHCILTGICPQHLETFESVENIILEKSKVFDGTKSGGFAVYGTDELSRKAAEDANALKRVPVGENGDCSVLNTVCTTQGISFDLALGILQIHCESKLLGEHNARNLALAAAMAFNLGMTKEEIAAGISKIDFVPHRLQLSESNGVHILDDAYNSNIFGAETALNVLRMFEGKKTVVTPGLVELGILEEQENRSLGEKMVGLDRVILVGQTLVTAVKNGYIDGGGDAEKLKIVPTLQEAQKLLKQELASGDAVLFLNDLPDIYN